MVIIAIVGALLLVGVYFFQRKMTEKVSDFVEESADTQAREASEEEKKLRFFGVMTSRLKIAIATYQIVLQSPGCFRITWGPYFSAFIASMSFLNFDFVKILPIQCYTKFNYISSMETLTMAPIAVSALIFLIYLCNSFYLSASLRGVANQERLQYAIKKLRVRFFSFFVMLSYLVLPGEGQFARLIDSVDYDKTRVVGYISFLFRHLAN